MNSQQKPLIQELMKAFTTHSSMDATLSFVASRGGLLSACQTLLKDLERDDTQSVEWVRVECEKYSLTFRSFVDQLSQLVSLFVPTEDIADYFSILGLQAGAGHDEIKKSYRKLSLRYHPDTATGSDPDASEKFMQITKAYHILIGRNDQPRPNVASSQASNWEPRRQKSIHAGRQKKLFVWVLGLVTILLIFSAVTSKVYKRKAMLAGLKESRGAFVPPQTKHEIDFADNEEEAKNHPLLMPEKEETFQFDHESKEDIIASTENKAESEDVNQKVKFTSDVESVSKPVEPPYGANGIEVREEKVGEVLAQQIPTLSRDAEKKLQKPPLKNQSSDSAEKNNITIVQVGPDHVHLKSQNQSQSDDPQVEGNIPLDKDAISSNGTKDHLDRGEQPVLSFNEAEVAKADSETSGVYSKKNKEVLVSVPVVEEDNRQTSSGEVDLQRKIDVFFAHYISAYEQRNLILFSRYFDADATENGKLFTTMLPVYMDLFATTSSLKMDLTISSWKKAGNGVSIDGRFKVDFLYTDAREIHGSGAIHFMLKENNGEFRIQSMEYEFDR
ncbi:J domain-containing protein [Desulforhopalus sp. IMCC35007]|uniref:J domain-containing protein n=1 Tax=Desulforhopalus sp. IMCC35007 TaxID=2569543 RepID=UPI001F1082DA|nr:J domain-containing protein [Desulforhopalus sp. IMCC35007]